MSLDKYIDKDEILETNKPVHGNIFSEEDIDLLTFENVNAQNPDLSGNGILELHVLFSLKDISSPLQYLLPY